MGEHDVGRARHRLVAMLGGAVVALALEGADHDGRGRARDRLVLDRARDREQRALREHLRRDRHLRGRERPEQRRPVRAARVVAARAIDRGGYGEPALAVRDDAAEGVDVLVAVEAIARARALGLREPVALLPHADRAGGDAGPLGHVLDGQTFHREVTIPSTTRSMLIVSLLPLTAAPGPGIESGAARPPYLAR
jgi:hypothetical protein